MGRRRKRTLKPRRPKKTIPKVFQCPNCGTLSLTVNIKEEEGVHQADIKCGSCKLHARIEVPPIFQPVDAYGKFLDLFSKGEIEVEFEEEESSEEESA